MKTISLKIDTNIFIETEKLLGQIHKSRNRYINDAIDHYNRQQKRTLMEEKLKNESLLTKSESMNVLNEFESLDYADKSI